jgi:hypothetical protein
MSTYEHEHDQDRQDAEALARAETLILEVATRHHPDSLSSLRNWVEHDAPAETDRALLRAALWSLLNERRLELTSERALRVAD